ncbi:MAG: hypothetical protein IRZ08_21215, partial [Frankia sp.]|nr:hypothetical protein [Frankia sp.]
MTDTADAGAPPSPTGQPAAAEPAVAAPAPEPAAVDRGLLTVIVNPRAGGGR